MAHLSVCRQKLIHVTRFKLIYKILILSSLGFYSKGSACFLEPTKKAQRPFTDFSETKRLLALFPPQLHSLHLPLPCSRLILSPSCWLAGKSNRFKDPMESLPLFTVLYVESCLFLPVRVLEVKFLQQSTSQEQSTN